MAVFEFVVERSEFKGGELVPRFSWRQLMDEWNLLLPDHHDYYYTDVRNYRRDYRAAKKALFGD
jgi:hypothetical protein